MNNNNSRSLGYASIASILLVGAAFAADDKPKSNPERDAYFGETHVHTSWSLDAWVDRQPAHRPRRRVKYLKGETIKHPLGFDIKIDTPLDWMGVTDHSEYVGRGESGEHAGFGDQQAAGSTGADPEGPEQPEDDAERVFLYCIVADEPAADQGAHVARDRRDDVEAKHRRSPMRTITRESSRRSAPTNGPRCRTT